MGIGARRDVSLSLKLAIFEGPQTFPQGFPGDGANGEEPACPCRRRKRRGFSPWLGRSPGGGHGNPLQYPCLENSKDRGAWWAAVCGVEKSLARLSEKNTDFPPRPMPSAHAASGTSGVL